MILDGGGSVGRLDPHRDAVFLAGDDLDLVVGSDLDMPGIASGITGADVVDLEGAEGAVHIGGVGADLGLVAGDELYIGRAVPHAPGTCIFEVGTYEEVGLVDIIGVVAFLDGFEDLEVIDIIGGGCGASVESDGHLRVAFLRGYVEVLVGPGVGCHRSILTPGGILVQGAAGETDVDLDVGIGVGTSIPADTVDLAGLYCVSRAEDLDIPGIGSGSGCIVHLEGDAPAVGELVGDGNHAGSVEYRESGRRDIGSGHAGFEVGTTVDCKGIDIDYTGVVAFFLGFGLDDTDVIDADTLGRSELECEFACGLGVERGGILRPFCAHRSFGFLIVSGCNYDLGALGSFGTGPEGKDIGLADLEGSCERKRCVGGIGLGGILSRKYVRVISGYGHAVGGVAIHVATLEVPVILEEGSAIIGSSLADKTVQIVHFLLGMPAEYVTEKFGS